ncbi:CBS domain-containing protein [Methanococcoides methylutens]|uniref:Inosine-5'-monophosphate dehydrogenase n=1 Tax=Methanococcoides methylutens MM1 TaxID=1434104 RepID=A0A0E3WZ96_METMT|nr:CBS domain-containing protein [Methanococcoides methylutens]AKB84549.1 Inosine-5'-monophosphate dehydrogenase [Methanococcoides methylutens MM1]
MPKDTLVRDVMVKDVACVALPGSRDEVLSILKDKRVSGLPVLKDNKVVGIVSRSNLLKNPTEEQLALLMARDPVTISPDEDITIAARLMLKHGIRRIPVVEDEKLVGLVTVADVVGSMVDLNITDPIGEYLNHGVGPVWNMTPLPVVARHMELAHVKAVPVIDSALDLVGIISDRDVISSSVIEDSVEMSDMSAGSDDDEWTWESMRDTMSIYYSVSRIKVPDVPVKDVMVKDPITASNNMGVSDCALKMKRHRIDQVPVVDANQKFIGLLRDRYLLKALLKY